MRFPVSAPALFAAALALFAPPVLAQRPDAESLGGASGEMRSGASGDSRGGALDGTRGGALAQARGGALDELRGEYGSTGPAPVTRQRRDALDADVAAPDTVPGLLRAAQGMIAEGRAGPANELIERAESRLLTRSTAPDQAGTAVDGGPVRWLAEARAALLRNDPARAQAELTRTLELLDRFRPRPGMGAEAPPASPPVPVPGAPVPPGGTPR